jgi:hypothetical protein
MRGQPIIATQPSSPLVMREQVRGKRQEADIGTTPTGMLKRSALVAASGAPSASSELVA